MRALQLLPGTTPIGGAILALLLSVNTPALAETCAVENAVTGESGQITGEVSTAELRQILADGSAIVLDSRRHEQYVAGHVPGAKNITTKPGQTYAEAVDELVDHDRDTSLVLYCNGPTCGASKRASAELVEAGYTNIRRYQVGIPMWRMLGGPTAMELEGVVRIYGVDNTAVYLDARSPAEYSRGTITGAHNAPLQGLPASLDEAPLPGQDFNTRVVIFGRDGEQARRLAQAFRDQGKAYHNVNYFAGTYKELQSAIEDKLTAAH